MHTAAALGKPGVAIFCEIKPERRLHSNSKIHAVFSEQDINGIPVDRVTSEVTNSRRELTEETRDNSLIRRRASSNVCVSKRVAAGLTALTHSQKACYLQAFS
ncbi:hypothetical protein [Paraburkholderia bryophila]|jgi:hypothetical protein|uniref:Uncharacterized protein n=1 Tax=Paraburkholderia bryophila TaxID=420952 RepID=A0A329BNP6_9BURK|nr:hypothetical protein [Paraburkholderia bryophila]RAS23510.1 hypothetical protein BX591_120116 [Paraburkholderia bryophila]